MSDQLKFESAVQIARALSTIPEFPRFAEAVQATAEDLERWCKGAILDGHVWSAEAQAHWLVTEARESWPEWQGTAALRLLFRGKFPQKTGIPGPCPKCAPDGSFIEIEKLDPDGWVSYSLVRCSCARGLCLSAMDAKRAEEKAVRDRKESPNDFHLQSL